MGAPLLARFLREKWGFFSVGFDVTDKRGFPSGPSETGAHFPEMRSVTASHETTCGKFKSRHGPRLRIGKVARAMTAPG